MSISNLRKLIPFAALLASVGFFVIYLQPETVTPVTTDCRNGAYYDATFSDMKSNFDSPLTLDDNGNIFYLYDNFERYSTNQQVIDGFESDEWTLNYSTETRVVDENYGGTGSLQIYTKKNFDKLILEKKLESDFWDDGIVSMWMKVSEPKEIDKVNLVLVDINGNTREFTPLINTHDAINTYSDDSEYPDIILPEGDPKRQIWTDFMLGKGWNYLFWQLDKFVDSDSFSLSKADKIQLHVYTNGSSQKLLLDDLRWQQGIQKKSNPTGGFWYPPHDRPQYGVYDIDSDDEESNLRLLNVRNTQYSSNGDHARMITSAPVPKDFAMRVNFELKQIGADSTPLELTNATDNIKKVLLDNTWLRITYDFEPTWDPGHDWFGAYLSLEYDKMGLVTVWPVERNVKQAQEPVAGNLTAAVPFSVKGDTEYEMHLIVQEQETEVYIYKVNDSCLEEQESVSYVFERPRHETRYPLAIESTGNMRTIINEVEISKI